MASGTNVPSPTFGATGFIPASDGAILTGTQTDINEAFGGNLNPALNTPQGQLASSEAAIIENAQQTFSALTQQMDPAYSYGRFQDGIARIYFISRNPALPTVLQVNCTGLPGVVIPIGQLIQDTLGNQYACAATGTIPAGGSVTLTFNCTVPGPVAVPASNGVSIYGSIPNWNSVSVVSGTIGQSVESRSAFEARREATVAGNSFGAIGAIIGQVAQVPDILDYFGYDNGSGSPVTYLGVTIPANSIYIAAAGATPATIAQAIFSKKSGGCAYYGNTTVTVYDSNPLYADPIAYYVTYEIPTTLDVLFAISIVNGPLVPYNAETLVQNAIISAFAGGDGGPRARIGSLLLATRFYGPIAALGAWAQVRYVQLGSSNTAAASFSAVIVNGAMTTSSTTGTIAIGQTVSDGDEYIPTGTTIISGSGTSWVLSNDTLNVAGASFTGTAGSPSTHLVVTSVTGIIQIGNVVVGTGITAGTTILGQLSGTIGGAGTYLLSAANTASSSSLTCVQACTGSVAASNSVQVQANQEPSVSAGNIAVTVD